MSTGAACGMLGGADGEAYLLVAILMVPATAAGTHAAIMATLMPFMPKAAIR